MKSITSLVPGHQRVIGFESAMICGGLFAQEVSADVGGLEVGPFGYFYVGLALIAALSSSVRILWPAQALVFVSVIGAQGCAGEPVAQSFFIALVGMALLVNRGFFVRKAHFKAVGLVLIFVALVLGPRLLLRMNPAEIANLLIISAAFAMLIPAIVKFGGHPRLVSRRKESLRLASRGLTRCELETLRQLLLYEDVKAVASATGRAEQTIRNHMVHIYRKLGVRGSHQFWAFVERYEFEWEEADPRH